MDDPLAPRFAELHARHGRDPEALVTAFLAMDDVVPPPLAADTEYSTAVLAAYRHLTEQSLDDALDALAQD